MNFQYKPKVVVLGAGAMGCLFGGLLKLAEFDVWLVDDYEEHINAISSNGLRMMGGRDERIIEIPATTDPTVIKSTDVVLVQCKGTHTEAVVSKARHLFQTGETVAVSFQNGLGNEEVISDIIGSENVLGGVAVPSAKIHEPGIIQCYNDMYLPSYIGELTGGLSERAQFVADAFSQSALNVIASADIRHEMWKKLLGNIGLGALSGATDLTQYQIMSMPDLRAVVLRAIDETMNVATASGINICKDDIETILTMLTSIEGGGDSKTSMRTDLERHRKTEVDYLYGPVIEMGRRFNVDTPTLTTLSAIIKGMESHY